MLHDRGKQCVSSCDVKSVKCAGSVHYQGRCERLLMLTVVISATVTADVDAEVIVTISEITLEDNHRVLINFEYDIFIRLW